MSLPACVFNKSLTGCSTVWGQATAWHPPSEERRQGQGPRGQSSRDQVRRFALAGGGRRGESDGKVWRSRQAKTRVLEIVTLRRSRAFSLPARGVCLAINFPAIYFETRCSWATQSISTWLLFCEGMFRSLISTAGLSSSLSVNALGQWFSVQGPPVWSCKLSRGGVLRPKIRGCGSECKVSKLWSVSDSRYSSPARKEQSR